MEPWMIAVFAGLVATFTALFAATMASKAPGMRRATNDAGWKVECEKCRAVSAAGDAGMVRLGAASKGKRTLLKCPACGKRSMMRVFNDRERH